MSATPQQPSQDAIQATSQPRRAYKPLRSRKAPAIQSAILAKRAVGTSKRQIAKQMQISPNTVTSVLELNNFDAQLTEGRALCSVLIPESVRVVKHRLAQNSETAAFRVLEGLGVLGDKAIGSKQPVQIELSQAIGIMFKQAPQIQADVQQTAITVTTEPVHEQKPSE